jgi:hypothetical protein
MANDPIVGVWRLNPAKSKFGGALSPCKELTVVYQEQDGQLVGTMSGISDDGSPMLSEYTAPSSGGVVHFSQGARAGGSVMTLLSRREDSCVAVWQVTIGEKVILTMEDVVSADGEILTVTATGNDAEGKPYEAFLVAERQ